MNAIINITGLSLSTIKNYFVINSNVRSPCSSSVIAAMYASLSRYCTKLAYDDIYRVEILASLRRGILDDTTLLKFNLSARRNISSRDVAHALAFSVWSLISVRFQCNIVGRHVVNDMRQYFQYSVHRAPIKNCEILVAKEKKKILKFLFTLY